MKNVSEMMVCSRFLTVQLLFSCTAGYYDDQPILLHICLASYRHWISFFCVKI